ncbi:MAG: bifunctional alpha/beta hydrolase/OsmC family protein [Gammaproteobacteria bacterium]|nr:bifunctional alpha/beta hydrolase/OsmC family protein [Gammaproteobacteria bacterium]
MKNQRVSFTNSNGVSLAGVLELPLDTHPHNYALFAHCFTCNKNLNAVRHITRALTANGFAVLRFDFTGLGESEGEFAESNFSSNVSDLESAADFLHNEYAAPALLVGHSLGGAAVLAVASRLDSVKAVATIGAPFSPDHVTHLFDDGADDIERTGEAQVNIGGRPFRVQKQFIDDLKAQDPGASVRNLRKALLVMHSPQDIIVGVDNAAAIYQHAKHPKSFISLDGADHLLSASDDSRYAGDIIASWANRYIDLPQTERPSTDQQLVASIDDSRGFTVNMQAGRHAMLADEPHSVGGNDFGPTPYDYVLGGLGSCTAMTLKMYALRKKWPLKRVTVHLNHDKIHAHDCECDLEGDAKGRIDRLQRFIEIEGELDAEQRARLLEIADRCPVHRTLEGDILITTELKK